MLAKFHNHNDMGKSFWQISKSFGVFVLAWIKSVLTALPSTKSRKNMSSITAHLVVGLHNVFPSFVRQIDVIAQLIGNVFRAILPLLFDFIVSSTLRDDDERSDSQCGRSRMAVQDISSTR